MANFTLVWDNAAVLASANSISQRVSYRRKDVGGSWITTGFIPVNDMSKSINSALSPTLLDNVIYEFRVQNICTTGGPTINGNGIQEQIVFACITPDVSHTDTASSISITTTALNITKARFTLRKQSDNTIVYGPVVASVISNTAQATATGLTASTTYYWQVELYTTVNNTEVISSNGAYIGAVCGPYNVTTSVPAVCVAPINLVVTANAP